MYVVMPITSKTNKQMPREQSVDSFLQQNQLDHNLTAITMDDLLKNIYSPPSDPVNSNKSVDDVWKDIVEGGEQRRGDGEMEGMTLEDFLTKAGAVREEDVRAVAAAYSHPVVNGNINGNNDNNMNNDNNCHGGGVGVGVGGGQYPNNNHGNGMIVVEGGAGRGRGKRRAAAALEEAPVDKATQQKQRRMIKNRESAARSRERKQAYTVELESLVLQLEEENARLRREEVKEYWSIGKLFFVHKQDILEHEWKKKIKLLTVKTRSYVAYNLK
ncbi:hypothetical protein K2173_020894 [Erythroxylum novogranatense]|uniref:BZIP domain-containing protein n=1 Tax=Erythroxylum novogranatense TaxID=1862640 RepID=A0AAV8TPX3_9ROSI|nr:hypothetical protein K2173_020894 [Erythroxylum novogranatense]